MARFGGRSTFGGLSPFGGGVTLWEQYYRILKSIMLPGLWPQDDDALVNQHLQADSKLLASALAQNQALRREQFPHTAQETLTEWAALLGVILPEGAGVTLAQQQAPIVARWRGSRNTALQALREMFVDLVDPTKARVDDFGLCLTARYTQDGDVGSTRSISSGALNIDAPAATEYSWDGTTLAPGAPRVFERLPSKDAAWADPYTWDTIIRATVFGGANAWVGAFVMQDARNATLFTIHDPGGGDMIRIDQIIDGVLTEDVGGLDVAAPVAPYIVRFRRTAAELTISTGASVPLLTTFAQLAISHKHRFIGWFARNESGSMHSGSVDIESHELTMDQRDLNVDIIEVPYDAAAPDASYFAYINTSAAQTGDPDRDSLLKLADRVKQAHTVLSAVGSLCFLTDDPDSLTDRDPLGA